MKENDTNIANTSPNMKSDAPEVKTEEQPMATATIADVMRIYIKIRAAELRIGGLKAMQRVAQMELREAQRQLDEVLNRVAGELPREVLGYLIRNHFEDRELK